MRLPQVRTYHRLLFILLSLTACGSPSTPPSQILLQPTTPSELSSPLPSSTDQQANALFIQAHELVQTAYEAEQSQPVVAVSNYMDALQLIERLFEDYPSSSIALDLTQGQAKLGPYTLTELRTVVVPRARMTVVLSDWPTALEPLLKHVNSNYVRASAYINFAETALQHQQENHAQIFLVQAHQEAQRMDINDRYTLQIYDELFDLYLDMDDSRAALGLAKQIETLLLKVQGDLNAAYVYRLIGQGYAIASQPDQAVAFAAHAEEALVRATAGSDKASAKYMYRVSPTGYIRATIARIGVRASQSEQAAQQIDSLAADDLGQAYAWTEVAIEYAHLNNLEEAMRAAQNIGDYQFLSGTQWEIATLLLRQNQPDDARPFIEAYHEAVRQQGEAAESWKLGRAASLFAHLGEFADAMTIVEQVSDPRDRAVAFSDIAAAYRTIGNTEQANQFLTRALNEVNSDNNPDEYALRDIVPAMAESHQYEQALNVIKGIETTALRAQALAHVLINLRAYDDTLSPPAQSALLNLLTPLQQR